MPGRWLGGTPGEGGKWFPDARSACQTLTRGRELGELVPKYDDIQRFVAVYCVPEGLDIRSAEQTQVDCPPGYFWKGTIQGICVLPLEQRLCGYPGNYAVVGMRPLGDKKLENWDIRPTGNLGDMLDLQLGHEQIFFCKDGKIMDNIGFFPKTEGDWIDPSILRKDNPSKLQEYVLSNDYRYDSEIMREAINSAQCPITYIVINTNCQAYISIVKERYVELFKERAKQR